MILGANIALLSGGKSILSSLLEDNVEGSE